MGLEAMSSEELARQGNYKDAVVARVRESGGGVSFVEITALLKPHLPVQGGRVLTLPGYQNIVLWQGMSHELCLIVEELVGARVLCFVGPEWLVYLADRALLPLPLVTEKTQYAQPHWLPVVLDLVGDADQEEDA